MAESSGFKREIGLFMAVMIGIGAMMGPGVFALPSEVAGSVGPLGIVAYLAMGLLTIFTALSYSELGVPDQCVVAALVRDESFVVPRGDTRIEAGDHVIFVGPDDAIKAAHDMFSAVED